MPRLLEYINFPKVVTVLASTFGVALGACGLTAVLANSRAGDYFLPFGIIELAVMALSALGLVLTVIVWIVVTAIGNRDSGTPGTIKLFEDSDKDERDS